MKLGLLFLLATTALLFLVAATPVTYACQQSFPGYDDPSETITIGAAVYGSNPLTSTGSASISVTEPYKNCVVSGQFNTQQGYSHGFLIESNTYFASQGQDWTSGQVGTWDGAFTSSNGCDTGNLPSLTAFINGNCADSPPGLAHKKSGELPNSLPAGLFILGVLGSVIRISDEEQKGKEIRDTRNIPLGHSD
ncbi:MAG: hypothetical protein JRM99_06755 [Nitrososphaerota archaeon]|nr:hypothetical protein [Nitrososphaerota archaeon]